MPATNPPTTTNKQQQHKASLPPHKQAQPRTGLQLFSIWILYVRFTMRNFRFQECDGRRSQPAAVPAPRLLPTVTMSVWFSFICYHVISFSLKIYIFMSQCIIHIFPASFSHIVILRISLCVLLHICKDWIVCVCKNIEMFCLHLIWTLYQHVRCVHHQLRAHYQTWGTCTVRVCVCSSACTIHVVVDLNMISLFCWDCC